MLGSGYARPLLPSAISGFTPRTNQSCSRGSPATSFVRPKKNFLEVCVFLGRSLKAPQVRRSDRAAKSKVYHIIRIKRRDEVEAPITEWLREAYELSDVLAPKARKVGKARAKPKHKPKTSRLHHQSARLSRNLCAAFRSTKCFSRYRFMKK
jgi:hypothetical protein